LLLRIPIAAISIANAVVIWVSLAMDHFVFGSVARYPIGVLMVGGLVMAYLPYYCVTRGETIFRNDTGGQKSRAVFYGIAYTFFIIFLVIDIDLLWRWVSSP